MSSFLYKFCKRYLLWLSSFKKSSYVEFSFNAFISFHNVRISINVYSSSNEFEENKFVFNVLYMNVPNLLFSLLFVAYVSSLNIKFWLWRKLE